MSIEYNYTAKHSNCIKKLCDPLFKRFNILNFRYTIIDCNNNRSFLISDVDIMNYLYNEDRYQHSWIDGRSYQHFKPGVESWNDSMIMFDSLNNPYNVKIGNDIYDNFNINNGITFKSKNDLFCEIAEFYSNSEEIYRYDYAIFYRFVAYFKQQARQHIQNAKRESFHVSEDNLKSVPITNKEITAAFSEFMLDTNVKYYYLSHQYADIYLTKKELICCYYAILGNSARDTASYLNCSIKTIERHFENMRSKLNVSNKQHVINIVKSCLPLNYLTQILNL